MQLAVNDDGLHLLNDGNLNDGVFGPRPYLEMQGSTRDLLHMGSLVHHQRWRWYRISGSTASSYEDYFRASDLLYEDDSAFLSLTAVQILALSKRHSGKKP